MVAVTTAQIQELYPDSALTRWIHYQPKGRQGWWEQVPFVPTHRVTCISRNRVGGGSAGTAGVTDYIWLDQPEGNSPVAYGYVPSPADQGPEQDTPRYAYLVQADRWQSLWSSPTDRIKVVPVQYRPGRQSPADQSALGDSCQPGWVYFIRAGASPGPVKIGWSGDVDRRLAQLQTANAARLELLGQVSGTMADERSWHARFAGLRIGGEWYHGAPELMEAIRDCCGRGEGAN